MTEREERRRLRDEFNLEGGNIEESGRMHHVDEILPEKSE